MEIGNIIANKRIQFGLSRAEFARIIGVDRVTEYRWEKGEIKAIYPCHIAKLCKTLDIDFSLFGFVSNSFSAESEEDALLRGWQKADKRTKEAIRILLDIKT